VRKTTFVMIRFYIIVPHPLLFTASNHTHLNKKKTTSDGQTSHFESKLTVYRNLKSSRTKYQIKYQIRRITDEACLFRFFVDR